MSADRRRVKGERVVAIIQARMGSTRLPGKVLLDLGESPVLQWVVERTSMARALDAVVVATGESSADDPIATWCKQADRPCFRGSDLDVLDRYYHAALAHSADIVVRITADCPLIDASVIDQVVTSVLTGVDYASNILQPRTYPRGLDVEAFRSNVLAEAWREDQSGWREHVTPYIYHHPEQFSLKGVYAAENFSHLRWTLDTSEDLEMLSTLVSRLRSRDSGWREIAALVSDDPELIDINANVVQKSVDS